MVGSSVKKTMEESSAARRCSGKLRREQRLGVGGRKRKVGGNHRMGSYKKDVKILTRRLKTIQKYEVFVTFLGMFESFLVGPQPNYSVAQIALERSLGVKAAAYAENDGATQFGSSTLTN